MTVVHRTPLSMEFSRQEYWSGLPFPSPRDLPNPGIEPGSAALQADSLPARRRGDWDRTHDQEQDPILELFSSLL